MNEYEWHQAKEKISDKITKNLCIFEEELQLVQEVLDAAKGLAERWVLAGAGKRCYPYDVKLDFKSKTIKFQECHLDGVAIYPTYESISFKYFEDNSNLEEDAKEEYNKKQKARAEKQDRIEELEKSSDVKEYLALNVSLDGARIIQEGFKY